MKYLVIIWAAVVFAYIMLALTADVHKELRTVALDGMATQNMTGIYGIEEAIESSGYWYYAIPVTVGLVTSTIVLKKDEIVGAARSFRQGMQGE